VAAAGAAPTSAGSAETTAAPARTCDADVAGAALRGPDDAVAATGAAHRSVSTSLASPTAGAAPPSLAAAGATCGPA
jgi:hypothetical protein